MESARSGEQQKPPPERVARKEQSLRSRSGRENKNEQPLCACSAGCTLRTRHSTYMSRKRTARSRPPSLRPLAPAQLAGWLAGWPPPHVCCWDAAQISVPPATIHLRRSVQRAVRALFGARKVLSGATSRPNILSMRRPLAFGGRVGGRLRGRIEAPGSGRQCGYPSSRRTTPC